LADGFFLRQGVTHRPQDAIHRARNVAVAAGAFVLVYNAFMAFRAQGNSNAAKRGRTPPPEETFEEAGFLKALGEKQKPVSLKLMDGQTVSGWIEYYDKHMVRLTREGAPNLFIFKHEIMYIAEDGRKKK
jgi:host factor-I protein